MRATAIAFVLLLILMPVAFAADVYDAGFSVRGMATITGGSLIDVTGAVTAKPANCYETYLPGYQEYQAAKKVWDEQSAKSEGVCRIDRPNLPRGCNWQYELVAPSVGVTGVLCWYGTKPSAPATGSAPSTPSSPASSPRSLPPNASSPALPLPSPPLDSFNPAPAASAAPSGLFGWFRRLFGGGAPNVGHPLSPDEAAERFASEMSYSELPAEATTLMFAQALPENTVIQDGIFMSAQLTAPAYVAWIDPAPGFLWGHPTVYMIMYGDGVIDIMTGNGWAIANGQDIRSVGVKLSASPSPTGGVVAVTGRVPGETQGTNHRRLVSHPAIEILPPPQPSPEVEGAMECPPGYTAVEEVLGEEKGMSLTVVGPDHARENGVRIDFPGEAGRFASTTSSANFEQAGPVTSTAALAQALQNAASTLKKPSTFAMFISAHGLDVWSMAVRNKNTGEIKGIDSWPGEPLATSVGISGTDWEIANKRQRGFCFQLGDKCVFFDPDLHLAPIASCRKFLAANSCFSGAFTEHNVPGLSAYASARKNEPARALPPVGGNTLIPSAWGHLFVTTLGQNPPLDPTAPDQDEPKPEFDAAYNAAGSAVFPGNVIRIRNARREILAELPITQQPVMHSIPHETGCQKTLRCIPPTGLPPPEESIRTCEDAMTGAIRTPRWLEKMIEDGAAFQPDRLEALSAMISNLEMLKTCGKCPPGTVGGWEGCNPDRNAIIDGMISILRTYGQARFQGTPSMIQRLDALVAELMKCKLVCRKPTERPLTGVIPSDTGVPLYSCPRGTTHTRKDCERACREVGGSCVEQDRCWSCQRRVVTGDQSQTALTTGQETSTTPKSCEEQCADRGMVISMPDWSSYILNKLNSDGVCKKNAQVSFGSYLRSDQCTCYPRDPPSVSISGDLFCSTPCGTVPCNSGTSCSCGDNCILTVTCNWGGWRQTGEQSYQPVVSSASSQ